VNRIWSVVLIIVAVLLIAGGTYWYMEIRPVSSQVSETSSPVMTEQSVSKTQTEAPVASSKVTSTPLPASMTTTTQTNDSTSTTMPAPVQNPENMTAKTVQSKPAPVETRPLPLPVDPLIRSGIMKLPKPNGPVVQIPYLPKELAKTISVTTSIQKKVEAQPVAPVKTEQAAPQTLVLTPSSPSTPTASTEVVEEQSTERPSWNVNASVSFVDFQYPGAIKGFDVQVDLLKQTDSLFSYGGSLEYENTTTNSEVSIYAKGQWMLNEGKELSFPISLAIGPTFIFTGSSTDIGITGKIQAGISYNLTDWMRFFYEAGVQAQWDISASSYSISLEPARIGFGFSF